METSGQLPGLSSSQISNSSQILPGILTLQEREIFDTVNFSVLCTLIGIFGISANVINIIIFFKQGFTNTVNISFFGLAISDLCCLLTMEWVCVCLNPLVARSEAPWVAEEFQYMTGAWPHVVCARITSFITVYVTAERCLCILAPLKVKEIVTPTRTSVILCVIYLLNITTLVPEYVSSFLDWKFIPEKNKTLLAVHYTQNRKYMEGVVYFLCSTTGMLSFISVITFTSILIFKLRQTSQWRTEASSSCRDKNEHISSRDKKTMKMVVIIAIILIVCYIPGTIISMATYLEPEFYVTGRYSNICITMWSFGFMLQGVNSSVNIFLYYSMSSNYRQTFHELFLVCRTQSTLSSHKQL